MSSWAEEMLKDYPEFLQSTDLVKLGIYRRTDAAFLARRDKLGPPFMKMKRKILYPKKELIKYLLKNTVNFEEEEE
jgi:hypothetical protein